MNSLRIYALQVDIKWEDVDENIKVYEDIIGNLEKKSDIIVFPEMFNTGFTTKPSEHTIEASMQTVEWMHKIAKKVNSAICASLIVSENEKLFNRFYCVLPDGQAFTYNKRHLFRLGYEDELFTAGESNISFEYKGFRIRPQICYDLRFPIWNRNFVDENQIISYDLLLLVANWPQSRIVQWEKLLMARAIENQAFVCGVNRVGIDGNGITYSGGTMFINFDGELICKAPDLHAYALYCELDLDALRMAREKMPFWKDWEKFKIY